MWNSFASGIIAAFLLFLKKCVCSSKSRTPGAWNRMSQSFLWQEEFELILLVKQIIWLLMQMRIFKWDFSLPGERFISPCKAPAFRRRLAWRRDAAEAGRILAAASECLQSSRTLNEVWLLCLNASEARSTNQPPSLLADLVWSSDFASRGGG